MDKIRIAVLIGHGKSKNGGYDSGAVAGGVHEYNLAREVGIDLNTILKKYDCEVELININKDIYLYDRADYVRKHNFDLCIELHLNACNKSASGTEAYHKHTSKPGKALASLISKNIAKNLKTKNRGAKIRTYKDDNGKTRDYFCIVRAVPCESLLIETVFIDSASDRAKIVLSENQLKCAQGIADAIVSTYGLKLKNKPKPKPAPEAKPEPKPSKPVTTGLDIGDDVTIAYGAVYGGCTKTRGKAVPKSKCKNVVQTVVKIQKNCGVKEALLSPINSWVALTSLNKVKDELEVNDKVFIAYGAVYGGCTKARGSKVPKSKCDKVEQTITKFSKNYGVAEALLQPVNSWVAVESLVNAPKK